MPFYLNKYFQCFVQNQKAYIVIPIYCKIKYTFLLGCTPGVKLWPHSIWCNFLQLTSVGLELHPRSVLLGMLTSFLMYPLHSLLNILVITEYRRAYFPICHALTSTVSQNSPQPLLFPTYQLEHEKASGSEVAFSVTTYTLEQLTGYEGILMGNLNLVRRY